MRRPNEILLDLLQACVEGEEQLSAEMAAELADTIPMVHVPNIVHSHGSTRDGNCDIAFIIDERQD